MLQILGFALYLCGCLCAPDEDDDGAHDCSITAASRYSLTPKNTEQLKHLDAIRDKVLAIALPPAELSKWRHFALVHSAHFSTILEGSRLTPENVQAVWEGGKVAGTEWDIGQVKGYLKSLELIEKWGVEKEPLSSTMVEEMNMLMVGGRELEGEDDVDREAQELQQLLLEDVVDWAIVKGEVNPCPIMAGIAHYQLANSQPFHDANGTTARLLANLILRLGNYHLNGLNCVEQHYALNPKAYREAIAVGGDRKGGGTAKWLDYFLDGLVASFEDAFARLDLRSQIKGQN